MNAKRHSLDINDGSLSSRKFLLTILGLLLITVVTMTTVKFPAVAAVLPTFIGGILGVLSLYFAGNVVAKQITGNNIKKLTEHEGE